MNDVLLLKGEFQKASASAAIPHVNIPDKKQYDTSKMKRILLDLLKEKEYWGNDRIIPGALISVHYIEVVAKSNRIKSLLSGKRGSNENIVGARFAFFEDSIFPSNHIITYNISLDELDESISILEKTIEIIDSSFDGKVNKDTVAVIENYRRENYPFKDIISKSTLLNVLSDCCYIDYIDRDIPIKPHDITDASIVTFYDVNVPAVKLLQDIGIETLGKNLWDKNTFLLNKDETLKTISEYPYFVSMATVDYKELLTIEEKAVDNDGKRKLPEPTNEPIIGVIDTAFDKNVYFENWVDYIDAIKEIPLLEEKDKHHGTAVSSIIVDGPYLNPQYDDGCGYFRVRHFRVANSGKFSSSSVMKNIREIVSKNTDIKVWNLSLGSRLPIGNNFISPEAAELDKLQNEFDIIFVVAGTNIPEGGEAPMKIGAPADSLNSLTVNAVRKNNSPASYSRTGPVLSFFYKPDVSYYGGDKNDDDDMIHVCPGSFDSYLSGTSFSAPWISRKMAYLIGVLGLSREVAKALIIDSAAGWNRMDDSPSSTIGYGVVPIRIEDIIKTKDDEIRFVMSGSIESYTTYTYNLPVPISNGTQPFYARATLCYSPVCDRNQGVDYTSTEMDIHFGRTYKDKKGRIQINSINENTQSDDIKQVLTEYNARNNYRKWDNIKHINETIKTRSKPKKVYEKGLWGLSIKTKERTSDKKGRGLQFGVVVTLKEMFGENRIEDFIQQCQFRGWLVNRLSVENMNKVNIVAEEMLKFDD